MKPVHVVLQVIALCILLGGLGVFMSGNALPVYTDPNAPGELSSALQDLPREERFEKWYEKLSTYETGHKRETDLGRGLMALGAGVSLLSLFLLLLSKLRPERIAFWIWAYWTILWTIKFPFTVWYYSLRQTRLDYPTWGDSIAIGMFQDFIAWVLGFVMFSILLAVFMIGRRFSSSVSLQTPEGGWGWMRTIVLWLWMILLAGCILPAIGDGDEGMVLSCTGAIPVVLLALSAGLKSRSNKVAGNIVQG